jgi:hypothetical protein
MVIVFFNKSSYNGDHLKESTVKIIDKDIMGMKKLLMTVTIYGSVKAESRF